MFEVSAMRWPVVFSEIILNTKNPLKDPILQVNTFGLGINRIFGKHENIIMNDEFKKVKVKGFFNEWVLIICKVSKHYIKEQHYKLLNWKYLKGKTH